MEDILNGVLCTNNSFLGKKISKKGTIENTKNKIGVPWIEKYRPNNFNNVELDPIIKHKLKKIINNEIEMSNVIFVGNPGTGKTTAILCLAKEILGNSIHENLLELNASDIRGIKIVDIIEIFCKKKTNTHPVNINNIDNIISNENFHNDKESIIFDEYISENTNKNSSIYSSKIIILDEADNITPKAQYMISNLIEKYEKTTKFAFICNKSSEIIESLQSKCIILHFAQLKCDQIIDKMKYICDKEKINFCMEALQNIAIISQGDLRRAINYLQLNSYDNSLMNNNIDIICDKPHPFIIKKIINSCFINDYKMAIKNTCELIKYGYPILDIAFEFLNMLKTPIIVPFKNPKKYHSNEQFNDDNFYQKNVLDEKTRLIYFDKIGNLIFNINKGANSSIQLIGCISNMCISNNN